MNRRPIADFPRNEAGLVDNFLGTAFDAVYQIYLNLQEVLNSKDYAAQAKASELAAKGFAAAALASEQAANDSALAAAESAAQTFASIQEAIDAKNEAEASAILALGYLELVQAAAIQVNEDRVATETAATDAAINTARFLKASTVVPTTRDDGTPLEVGDQFFNTTTQRNYVYSGTAWVSDDSTQALNDFKDSLADNIGDGGAERSGWDSSTVADALRYQKSISSIASLALYSGPALACWIRNTNEFGYFEVDTGDTTTVGDAITVVVDTRGRRWKRKYTGPVNIRWAGAKGDGSDDTAAIQKCLDLFRSVYIPEGEFWVTSLQFKGGKLHGPGSDAVLRKIGEGPMIQAHGSLGEALLLSAAPVIGNNVISVLSGASFNPGEWAILESMDPVYPGDSGGRAGEIVRVQSHVGNTITLHAPIIFTYTLVGGVRLRKVNWMDSPVLKDFQIRMNPTANADLYNDQADAIDLMFCVTPTVERVFAREGKQAAVRLTGCVEGLVDSCRAEDLASADDDVTGGYGYGVHERGANLGLIVRGGRYSRVRSAYTTGFGFNSIYPHGVSVNALITGNVAIDTFSGSFTTHPSGIYTTISGNTIHGCRSSAINVRAKGTMVLGNMISKTMGAGVLVVYDKGAVSDAVISNNTLMDTNQGITPSGEDHRNYGAIQDSGPNTAITDNKIYRCGGPAVRSVSTRNTVVTGNLAVDPCQNTATRKYAFGGDVAGQANDYMLMSDNHCSSSDGKVVNLIQKPNNTILEGTNNTARGISGALYSGESASCYLSGSNGRSNKVVRGRAVTVRLAADVLNLDQESARSGMIVVWAESGSSSDTMSSIVGGLEGSELLFRCVDGNTITILNGSDSTNNIRTSSGSNLVLSGAHQVVRFVKYNALWTQC